MTAALELEFKIGHENFANYRRMAYKWWYAIAEFIDNSTQSYLDNAKVVSTQLIAEGEPFKVIVATDDDFIRIRDNAMGMSLDDLRRAVIVGLPPENASGRCRYGLGMKTAACWIGNKWRIITTKIGDANEYTVEVDVREISRGNMRPPTVSRTVGIDEHYTIIEIRDHNRPLKGRTIGKVKDYLKSIYRLDLVGPDAMHLIYDDQRLVWDKNKNEEFLARKDGSRYKKEFIIETKTEPKKILTGWVGILEKGSRSRAGFSILHRKRVIKGWPDSWRPEKVFGAGGRNDLINQRLVGEVNLEDFEVSHTKDDINWHGDEEESVEAGLLEECRGYMEAARKHRHGQAQGHGPEQVHIDAAVQKLHAELVAPGFLDKLTLEDALPPPEQVHANNEQVVKNAAKADPSFTANLAGTKVIVYLDGVGSPNDPYIVNQDVSDQEIVVVVNIQHPHWSMLEGENAVINYLRHCVYDAIAEHKAVRKTRLNPETIKLLKDQYLRVAFELLQDESKEDLVDEED